MATPRANDETSVMISLRELRAIDTARRADEAMARDRAIADAKRKAEEAEAARRAVEAAAIAARELEVQRAREAEERSAREADLRVREAEARARAAAEAALAARRLDEEMQLRREAVSRTRPKAMLALLGVVAAAALGLGALYVARSHDVDALGTQLDDTHDKIALQQQRIAGLEKARVGTELVIHGLRAQILAIDHALIAEIPRTSTSTPVRGGGHHPRGTTAGTPPAATPGMIDLGDCAKQPLLCGK